MKTKTTSRKIAKNGSANGQSKSDSYDHNEGLRELFMNELKDIYWAEKALTKAIPKMMKKATSEELTDALESHLEETEGHVSKVEEVFAIVGEKPVAKKCEAMSGLIKEAEEIMKESEQGPMRDAGIISAAQKVEHYEMASYGTLRTFAHTLGMDDASDILESILEEEKAADEKLTSIAENNINQLAVNE